MPSKKNFIIEVIDNNEKKYIWHHYSTKFDKILWNTHPKKEKARKYYYKEAINLLKAIKNSLIFYSSYVDDYNMLENAKIIEINL